MRQAEQGQAGGCWGAARWWQEVLGAHCWDGSPCWDLGRPKPATCMPSAPGLRLWEGRLLQQRSQDDPGVAENCPHLHISDACILAPEQRQSEWKASSMHSCSIHLVTQQAPASTWWWKNCHLFKKRWTRSTAVYYKRYFQKNVLLK